MSNIEEYSKQLSELSKRWNALGEEMIRLVKAGEFARAQEVQRDYFALSERINELTAPMIAAGNKIMTSFKKSMTAPSLVAQRFPTARRAFLSHASENAELAEWVKLLLQHFVEEVHIYVSSIDTRPGGEWMLQVRDGLQKADALIVLCSKESVHKPWVLVEAGGAWCASKLVIPLCLHGVDSAELPGPLSSIQSITLPPSLDRDFADVARCIDRIADLLSSLPGVRVRKRMSEFSGYDAVRTDMRLESSEED